jgi:Tol biopolymer transport system component/DNA-binding winged helix-turn-helix (wHTH) protein
MSLAVKHSYRFGEFAVDDDQKVLLRNGSLMPLAPKVFDTLLILVENSGRIVAKEELMRRLWPDSFVEESNLTFNIQQLRKALGDNARQPQFIETVARRGYRFIADVNGDSAPPIVVKHELSSPSLALSVPASKKTYFSMAAVGTLLIASTAFVWWLAQRRFAVSQSSLPILSRSFKSEKFITGGFVHAAITPDGKYVAYSSETGGKESIWLRQLATGENIQIVPPTDEKFLGLVISHDGNSLYFVRDNPSDTAPSALYRVMTFGGIPVKIAESTEGTVSLSPDDKQLSFIRPNQRDDDFRSLHVIDVDGRNERRLLTRKRPIRLSGAQFSPDGQSIAFASGQSSNGGSDFRLMRVDLASGAESMLTSRSFFNIRNLKWLPDGNGLLFTASESLDATFRIWHVLTATGEASALTNDATDYYGLSLDQAADKLIATHVNNTFHLYLSKLDDLDNPMSLTVGRGGVAFTPDGKIIYERNDGDIWIINQEGGEQRQLTNNPFRDIYPRVSPDGRYVFFTSNRTGSSQVWRMNIDGTNQIQLTKYGGGYPEFVTPDGKWVYFLSGLHQNLWRVPTDGGEEKQVLDGTLYDATLSPHGNLLAYIFRGKGGENQLKLAVANLEDQKVLKTFSATRGTLSAVNIAWASDNKSFYYISTDGFRNSLWQQSLNDQQPQFVRELGNEEIAHLTVSPDGTRLAFVRGRWLHDAVLIEGLK